MRNYLTAFLLSLFVPVIVGLCQLWRGVAYGIVESTVTFTQLGLVSVLIATLLLRR
jgi:hypothetical protein